MVFHVCTSGHQVTFLDTADYSLPAGISKVSRPYQNSKTTVSLERKRSSCSITHSEAESSMEFLRRSS
jgi:hypothetical protein